MTQQPAPGWYQDPRDASQMRWWDGQGWTNRVYGQVGGKPWYKRVWPWLIVAVALALVVTVTVVMWPRVSPRTDVEPDTTPSVGFNVRTYGGTDVDAFYAVAAAPDGDIIAVGYTASPDGDFPTTHGGTDAVITRLAPDGSLRWFHTYGRSGEDYFSSVVVAEDGDIIAVGCTSDLDPSSGIDPTTDETTRDAVVFRWAPDGDLRWSHTYGGSDSDAFNSVALDGDGNIIVVGRTSSPDGDFPSSHGVWDVVVARLTPDGDLQWSHTYGGSNIAYLSSVAVTPDGAIIAAGYTGSPDGDFPTSYGATDALVVRLTLDGTLQWFHTYGGNGDDSFSSVALTPDGAIIVVGDTTSPDGDFPSHGEIDAVIARLTPDGTLQWSQTYGGNGTEQFASAAVAPDGSIMTVGNIVSPEDGPAPSNVVMDALATQWTSDGVLHWSHTYGGSSIDVFASVAVAADGGFLAAGWTGSTDGDFPDAHGFGDAVLLIPSQL